MLPAGAVSSGAAFRLTFEPEFTLRVGEFGCQYYRKSQTAKALRITRITAKIDIHQLQRIFDVGHLDLRSLRFSPPEIADHTRRNEALSVSGETRYALDQGDYREDGHDF